MIDWEPAECVLPTRWTATVDPRCPLPEYPRPQLVRPDWLNLNGVYECAIRPVGEARPASFDLRILVPFPVESALSGVAQGVSAAHRVWYRRTFTAPRAPQGQTWLLHFGAVDWRAEVWLDGAALGVHEGGFDPFSFDAGVLGGEHELVVAVWDPTDDGPQPRGKQARHPSRVMAPFFYSPVTGIWQTVWLEQVPATRLGEMRLCPDGDRLRIKAGLVGARGEETLRAVASVEGRAVAEAVGKAGDEIVLHVPDGRRWSPADPFLYDLTVSVARGQEVLDRVGSYFGLRNVAVQRDARGVLRVHVNGEPTFLHGLLDQGWWPDGLYTAPCDAALRFDLEETKRLGFNLVRKHVKVEPARWYWHCDRFGLLVIQDMPNGDRMTKGIPIGGLGPFDPTRWLGRGGIRRTAASAEIFERELASMIAALGNSPAIIAWVPFNEGWGQYDAVRIGEWVRSLDSSRLVDVASGWIDSGTGDVRDVHVYYPGPRMPARPDPKRAEVLGEWGGLGLEVPGHRWPKRPFAYKLLPGRGELEARYASLIDQLVALKARGLSIAVYTQTTDVEGEVNGLFTYDREVLKIDAARLAEMHRRLVPS